MPLGVSRSSKHTAQDIRHKAPTAKGKDRVKSLLPVVGHAQLDFATHTVQEHFLGNGVTHRQLALPTCIN